MRTPWLVPAVAYLVFLVAPGCIETDPLAEGLSAGDDEAIGASVAAIQGGYEDTDDTNVVGVIHLTNGGVGACTGTLIAPNVVLTARHCVASSGNGGVMCGQTEFSPSFAASSMYVTTNAQFTQNPADYYRAKEIFVPNEDPTFCGYDQAIIVLDGAILDNIAVPAIPRVDSSLTQGEEYYAVGYGQRGENGPSGARYRRDKLFTECVAEGCPAPYVAQQEFIGDTGVCQGDSGGPAFDLQNRVVGVASRGSAGCGNPVYGHVFGHGQWIKDTTRNATSAAGIDVPAWADGYPTDEQFSFPVGGACEAPSDCLSNACFDNYCTRPCNEAAYCPDDFVCGASGYCEKPPEPAGSEGRRGKQREVSACTVTAVGQDPTKPIPWVITPLALAALLLSRRRRG